MSLLAVWLGRATRPRPAEESLQGVRVIKVTGKRRIHAPFPGLDDARRRRWAARRSLSGDDETGIICGLGCVSDPSAMVRNDRLAPAIEEVMVIFTGSSCLMNWIVQSRRCARHVMAIVTPNDASRI